MTHRARQKKKKGIQQKRIPVQPAKIWKMETKARKITGNKDRIMTIAIAGTNREETLPCNRECVDPAKKSFQ